MLPTGQIAGATVAPTGGAPIQMISGLGGAPSLVNTGDGLPTDGGSALPAIFAVAAALRGVAATGLLVDRRCAN